MDIALGIAVEDNAKVSRGQCRRLVTCFRGYGAAPLVLLAAAAWTRRIPAQFRFGLGLDKVDIDHSPGMGFACKVDALGMYCKALSRSLIDATDNGGSSLQPT